MMTIAFIKRSDEFHKPLEPQPGDVIMDGDGITQVFTNNGWEPSSSLKATELTLAYRQALEIYAGPDNWIGNEFWADGGGDPKRFAREALRKL